MKRALLGIGALSLALGVAWWLHLPDRLGWDPGPDGPLLLYGNVDIRQVRLGFRVSGRVAEMALEEGDRVEAGTTLARLDSGPYQDSVSAAEARVAAERATLAKLEAGPRAAEVDRACAVLAERKARLVNAQQAFERTRQLRPRGTVSESALDEAQAARDVAVARETAAREALRLLEEGTRAEDLAVARANLQAAKAARSAAETSLEDTVLLAPAEGIVLSRVTEPGAIVSPSDSVYVLSLSRPLWVRAYIAEPLLGKIHPGMKVEVLSDSAPKHPYRGQVGFISPVAEFTPKSVETPELRTALVYRLRVIVEQPDNGLRQGMPVTIRVPLPAGDDSRGGS